MIHEYDPASVIISFGGHKFEVTDPVIEEPPRRAMLYKPITLKLITTVDTTRGLRRMMNRLFPYLTPRKRRRIKRRGERGYLEKIAIGFYAIQPLPGEFTKALRARVQATWDHVTQGAM